MIYQYRQPSCHLRQFIRDYVLAHFTMDPRHPVPLKPFPAKPQGGIVFYIKGFLLAEGPALASIEKRAGVQIVGQQECRQTLQLAPEFLMIDVIFQPGALHKLLGVPMNELLNKHIEADLLFGNEIQQVYEQLQCATSYELMFFVIEKFLSSRIKKHEDNLQPIDKIGAFILDNPNTFNLDFIANQACLSYRQFERRFIQQAGVSPRLYQRMARFRKAFELKLRHTHLSWLDIAWQVGYTDYQHLAKDCKQFSGNTPNQLLQEEMHAPAHMLGVKLQYYR